MKIRTVYFKTTDLAKAIIFWQDFLSVGPNRKSTQWTEFKVGETRVALLLNNFGDTYTGSSCVPVFEFLTEDALGESIKKAKELRAEVVLDSLGNQNMQSIVLNDFVGNEFELTRYHD
jgi:hypothetical protein